MEDEEKSSYRDTFAEVFALIIGLLLLARVVGVIGGPGVGQTIVSHFASNGVSLGYSGRIILLLFIILSNCLSALFIVGFIYSAYRLYQLETEWRSRLYPVHKEETPGTEPKNSRWDDVIAHIQSENASDWRLAILEADIVLDDMLDTLGYIGDTMADKLKAADPAKFRTLNSAWEAHKIRNAIAHEGQEFTLTHREGLRVINLYESVFHEFDYI